MSTPRKSALVTGSATGVGRAVAVALAKRGLAIAVNYSRSQKEAEETAAEVRQAGVPALLCKADVANDGAVRAMVARCREEFGGLDVLVAPVGGGGLLAAVAAQRGQLERAGCLWGAIEDEDAGAPLGGWRRHRQTCEALIREASGPQFERARAESRALPLDDAVALALESADA